MSGSEQASPEVVDTARDAAAGTRAAAKWMASALGAVPSLAIIGAIVRDPGEGGFDATELAVGVGLAALGAIVGVLAFARVIAPVRVEDKNIEDAHLKRIPGQPYDNADDLKTNLETLRALSASAEFAEQRAIRNSKRLEVVALQAAQAAVDAATAAKTHPQDVILKDAAEKAQSAATAARAEADAATASAAAQTAGTAIYADQLARTDHIRSDAYSLYASDTVSGRFRLAQILSVVAVALIAAGVVLIGLAPQPKPSSSAITLVTLKPNEAGQAALGCAAAELTALRTGGTDTAPKVITLPTAVCPSRTLTFTTTAPKSLGEAKAVEPLKAGG